MLNENKIPESTDWTTRAKATMKEWNEKYCLWKKFDKSQVDLVKSYVGLILFGTPKVDELTNSELHIATLYYKYDPKQIIKINKIVRQFQFENNELSLSHTLLYLSIKDLAICVFRQTKSSGEVNFIDFDCRLYTSWQDFLRTNKLPKCEYMAPINGIHDSTADNVEVHKSPASSKLSAAFDFIALGATIAAGTLIGISIAPVTATVLGIGSVTYGVGQSFHDLRDRKKHKQSIAPSNLESMICYMNIGTSFICGASALSAMKSARIMQLSGKYCNISATILKGVNFTAKASTFTNFGLHLFILKQKARNGEVSFSDLFNLCIDLFLMYGAVSGVREMRSSLPNFEVDVMPKGLSKSARRRWRKRQAKLTSSFSTNRNSTKVGAWDREIFQTGIGIAGSAFKKLISDNYPDINKIYDNVRLIIDVIRNFFSKKISLKILVSELICHCNSLYNLLQSNVKEIEDIVKKFLQRCCVNASSRSVADISNIINNAVVAINNVNDYEEVSQENDLAPELTPSNNIIAYKMILDVVKDRVYRREIGNCEKLLSVFTQELESVVNEIKTRMTQDYAKMLSYNFQLLGEKKGKIALSGIGMNSKNDFANMAIEQTITSLKSSDRVDALITIEEQLDEIFSLYQELFRTLTDENDNASMGALETCEILKNSIKVIIQPITSLYAKCKKIYETNVRCFGPEKAMIFVSTAMDFNNVPANCEVNIDSRFLGLVIRNFNLRENKSSLLPIEENRHEPITDFVSFTDIFKMETLLNICDFYARRIGYNEKNPAQIYSFVTDKFTNHLQSLPNQENATTNVKDGLKLNNKFLGKNYSDQFNKFLRETNEMEIFNRVVEIFKEEDFATELIAGYHKTMHNVADFHAEYLKHLVADDGVTIHTVTIENRNRIGEFQEQAEKLFNLNKHSLSLVEKTDNLIVLKNANNKSVVFHFGKNKTEALVLLVDSSENIEEK